MDSRPLLKRDDLEAQGLKTPAKEAWQVRRVVSARVLVLALVVHSLLEVL